MKNEKKTRREALGLLGKTGILLGGSYFFLSMKIAPEGEKESELLRQRQRRVKSIQEKALIVGSGSRVTVKVTGKPGRHFFIAMASSDEKKKYKPFPGSKGVIGADGNGSININMKDIVNNKIYLKVVTADTDKFDKSLAVTEAFIIKAKDGVIEKFEGSVSHPVLNSKSAVGSTAISSSAIQ